ncbi:glycosyl hydrolase catalytic core-domain-containing protein [Flagelloscypha sp. PMI_526]|nr:glycosyl hydrolase catalytic core-domain-containing protein [Flagelloscypha sp. PMI_526]
MSKLLNFVTLSSLLALTFVAGPAPVSAVAVEGAHSGNIVRSHHGIAKRKRSNAKRCKPRNPAPTSSSAKSESTKGSGSGNGNSNSGGNDNGGDSGGSTGNNSNQGEFSQLGYPFTLGDDKLQYYKQGKTTLIYNWRDNGPSHDGFEFIPMVWGGDSVDSFIAATNKRHPKFALGCNEPELNNDSGLSSGMSTSEVVDVYWKALDPLRKKGTAILTPAVTSGQKGFDWMQDFMKKCSGCKFAGQALHWYDISADNAIAHFKKHHDAFGLPIYITEMAFNNFNGGRQLSVGEAKSEMAKFNEWAKGEGSSFIKVVMYFGFQDDMVNVSQNLKLIDGSGKPNDLGRSVINSLAQ